MTFCFPTQTTTFVRLVRVVHIQGQRGSKPTAAAALATRVVTAIMAIRKKAPGILFRCTARGIVLAVIVSVLHPIK